MKTELVGTRYKSSERLEIETELRDLKNQIEEVSNQIAEAESRSDKSRLGHERRRLNEQIEEVKAKLSDMPEPKFSAHELYKDTLKELAKLDFDARQTIRKFQKEISRNLYNGSYEIGWHADYLIKGEVFMEVRRHVKGFMKAEREKFGIETNSLGCVMYAVNTLRETWSIDVLSSAAHFSQSTGIFHTAVEQAKNAAKAEFCGVRRLYLYRIEYAKYMIERDEVEYDDNSENFLQWREEIKNK